MAFNSMNFLLFMPLVVLFYFALPLKIRYIWLLLASYFFYTFQVVGYMIDVYRQEVKAEKNFLRYALFVSSFPQIGSGPIARIKKLLKQQLVFRWMIYMGLFLILIFYGVYGTGYETKAAQFIYFKF